MGVELANVGHMTLRVVPSSWLKALTCLAFAMALVFSPPSAVHAASGMHDGHHTGSMDARSADPMAGLAGDAHDGHAMHGASTHGETADLDEDQDANQCCNGICVFVAVVLNDDRMVATPVAAQKYLRSDAQSHSVDTLGLLRPPRFLI